MKWIAFLVLTFAVAAPPQRTAFSGTSAFEYTRRSVAFGPRPSGSPELARLRAYILAELKLQRCEVSEDSFKASTPRGAIAMKNIIARFPGTSGRAVVVSGHYDTKAMPGTYFVGANDGGSSTGFLLEMARALARTPHKNDIWLVFFDGEEAVAQWSDTDGTYGSRHLAAKWSADGTLAKIKAMINVDMIGDRDLSLIYDDYSAAAAKRVVWSAASRLGYGKQFPTEPGAILDDHIPFVRAGVNAVDLIDFTYGPANGYWHTDQDTMDKLSARSLGIVGEVVLGAIQRLEP